MLNSSGASCSSRSGLCCIDASRDHDDGDATVRSRDDAIAATAVSDTPRRPRRGPKRLKLEKETSHDLLSWRRVAWKGRHLPKTPRAHWYMGSTFAMSARQKYSSDARFATGLYSSDVLLTSTEVTSASCILMLTSFDLCIDR